MGTVYSYRHLVHSPPRVLCFRDAPGTQMTQDNASTSGTWGLMSFINRMMWGLPGASPSRGVSFFLVLLEAEDGQKSTGGGKTLSYELLG